MFFEFLLSHEDVTILVDVIKKVNVGDATFPASNSRKG
jgi:hypothetical protein